MLEYSRVLQYNQQEALFHGGRKKVISKDIFRTEILEHPVIAENPYTKEFAFGNAPNPAEIKDFLVQFFIFQNVILSSDGDGRRFNLLCEFAAKIAIVPARDLNGHALGDVACASRETIHCLHQIERSRENKNASVREGARAALRERASHGAKEDPATENSLWQITEGLRWHNRMYRGGFPLPLDFFEHNLALVAQYGDCFLETRRRSAAIPDFAIEDWRRGAKTALDAVYLFWSGLEKRRKRLH